MALKFSPRRKAVSFSEMKGMVDLKVLREGQLIKHVVSNTVTTTGKTWLASALANNTAPGIASMAIASTYSGDVLTTSIFVVKAHDSKGSSSNTASFIATFPITGSWSVAAAGLVTGSHSTSLPAFAIGAWSALPLQSGDTLIITWYVSFT